MVNSIIKKEWLKTRFILALIVLVSIFCLGYFAYNLNFLFHTVEPESMMWYRFVNLEHKPYENISVLIYIIAFSISLAQFLPERVRNRIKIITHLPISLEKAIFLHLLVGFFFLISLNVLITFATLITMNSFYPNEILIIVLKDFGFNLLGSTLLYLGVSAAIIEKKAILSILKLVITIFTVFVFYKKIYNLDDLFFIFLILANLIMVQDSFKSIKEQRVSKGLYFLFAVLFIPIISFFSYQNFKDLYQLQFNKYYIFYSPILKKFVYQKNFGEHQFEYGIKEQKTFDRKEYESYLPFVYWRNLDIQKKLPIKIDKEEYSKNEIKNSRLSFTYNSSFLKQKEVQLYPLINPNTNQGIIKFPEEMFAVNNKQFKVYSFNTFFDDKLTFELNSLLQSKGVILPTIHIWGKTTNMKPFDLGYFIIDKKDDLYRLNREDNKLHLEKIDYPKNIDIKFIKISENKQQKLAGYAIDKNSNFYLIDYKTFEFKKLELKGFDYKTMKLQLIANPKYYQVRFNDGKKYHAVVFDKNLKKLDEIVLQ